MLVSRFLVERLENAGVKHVFGLPGDYLVDLHKDLKDNKNIVVVNNTDENNSGFIADAYARVKGLGCVVVDFADVPKLVNAVQCAHAERSPLIIIAGAPGLDEGGGSSQMRLFHGITCAGALLDNPSTAGYLIDQTFEALQHYKRPVYIELPRDVAKKPISYDVYKQGTPVWPKTDPDSLDEALAEVCDRLLHAERPVILAGAEVARCGLSDKMIKFAERFNLPVAATLLSKSVISERHPLFAGVYGVSDNCAQIAEDADCLLMIGVLEVKSKLKNKWLISANIEGLRIRNHAYPNVQFVDFCEGLFRTSEVVLPRRPDPQLSVKVIKPTFEPKVDVKITGERLFQKIDSILNKDLAVIADMGEALAAKTVAVHDRNHFLSPVHRETLGWAIPAAIGFQLAKPNVRPLVVVGETAFQMSCVELSTILNQNLNPIILVMNEENPARRWEYHKVTELFGGGVGVVVETEDELDKALTESIDSKRLFVINIRFGKNPKT